jgi:hypothetical protein
VFVVGFGALVALVAPWKLVTIGPTCNPSLSTSPGA